MARVQYTYHAVYQSVVAHNLYSIRTMSGDIVCDDAAKSLADALNEISI